MLGFTGIEDALVMNFATYLEIPIYNILEYYQESLVAP